MFQESYTAWDHDSQVVDLTALRSWHLVASKTASSPTSSLSSGRMKHAYTHHFCAAEETSYMTTWTVAASSHQGFLHKLTSPKGSTIYQETNRSWSTIWAKYNHSLIHHARTGSNWLQKIWAGRKLEKLLPKQSFLMRFYSWASSTQNVSPPFCLRSWWIELRPKQDETFVVCEMFQNPGIWPASYVFMKSPLTKMPNLGMPCHLKPVIFQSFTCCNKISHLPRKKYINCRIPFNNTALHPWKLIIWNLKITQLKRKIMFHPPPFVGSKCQLFQGVYSMGPQNLHV